MVEILQKEIENFKEFSKNIKEESSHGITFPK
jgi:hypothetical protein